MPQPQRIPIDQTLDQNQILNQTLEPSDTRVEEAIGLHPSTKGWGQWFSRLKVGQKISLGYELALGIAVLGTTTGLLVADHYHQVTIALQHDAIEETQEFDRLQSSIFMVKDHQQQFIVLLENPELLRQEYSHFSVHLAEVRQRWSEFQWSEGYTKEAEVEELDGEVERLRSFLETYEGLPEEYFQQTEALLKSIYLTQAQPEAIESARKRLLEFGSSSTARRFNSLSEELAELKLLAYEEYDDSEIALGRAQTLRVQIIGGGMMVSIAIAILFALATGRAIARPIQTTSKVAQKIIQTRNFDLQAPVTSQDEVGELTTALNQLVWKVKDLLQEQTKAKEKLETYNYTLEQQVATRTQELSEKNSSLEQTLRELERTQLNLIQSEKMSSLGQMVAGVAHEINNPVNFIHGNLTYVKEYAQDLLTLLQLYHQECPCPSPQLQKTLAAIDIDFLVEDLTKVVGSMYLGTDRIREIVLSLRNFSRLDESELKAVNIHEGIDNTLVILNNRLKASSERPEIQVIKNYGQLPLVHCYAGSLNQVFMNILGNAIDALDEQQLTFQEIEAQPNTIHIQTEVTDDQWAVIRIADNGKGISESDRCQMFTPFFTTKSVGKGTGLGLSISYQIVVEKHGGKLSCQSAIGQGTEFVIQVPL
ncbi:MAG: HAMP domain-containing protein [Leptolyngbyaceae cyanobacterium CSU_1_4]|nr:HAMP domain-containing protein [Leptolyngbyaceae cyanobacterium CSU_1_4]